MPPKTPSRPPTTRSASAKLSRQSSASASTPNLNGEIEETKPVILESKVPNGTSKHARSGPEFTDNVTFVTPPKSKAVTKSKATPKMKAKPRPSLLSVLLRLSFLTLAAYTFLCPLTNTSANEPITGPCTLLARAHTDIYNPFIEPHVQSAWNTIASHPQVGPYAQHVENAYNYVTPYVSSVRSTARGYLIPVVEKANQYSSLAYAQASTAAKPYVEPYAAKVSAAVDPYWRQALDVQREHISPRWLALRAQAHHAVTVASPHVLRARVALIQGYDKIRPHVYALWLRIKVLAKRASAAIPIAALFDVYIKPHWDKIVGEVGKMSPITVEKTPSLKDQAKSTLSAASSSASSAAAAAQTTASSAASVVQSQASGFAAQAQASVMAAASAVQSVASEYVSVVQDKLSSITSAAQATGTSISASGASASHKASEAVVNAASAASESAADAASHASYTAAGFVSDAASVVADKASTVSQSASKVAATASAAAVSASSTASEYVASAASTVSESASSVLATASSAASSASSTASEYVASIASAASSSAADFASDASSAVSHAAAAATTYASELEDAALEVPPQIYFKAAALASSAYSKAALAASSASEAAASAQATAAELAASASANVNDAAAAASASLASLAAAYQSQAALVAALAQSSASAASASLSAKLQDAREAVGIHETSPEAAAAEIADLLGKLTPAEDPAEVADLAKDDFEAWFASLLGEDDGAKAVGTETALPPSPIAEASVPAEIPEETSRPKYKRPSDEEIAEKRKEIEASHNKWEEMLHAIGQGGVERLTREIEKVRKASSDKLLGEDGGQWGKDVAAYEKEVGRVVEGVERYASKLRNEDRPAAEKTQMLRDVVAKVRDQVERWAGDVESKLKTWWTGSEAGIIADVEKAEKDVMDIAAEAQNELGMKYAWLEDVTAQDWKRYHALVDDANQYGKTYRDLLYLTEDSPLYKALAELTSHIQDVLLGFEARLALIHPFADPPVSGAEDKDPLVSPDLVDEKPQAPLFIPGAMAQDVGAEAYLKRSKEEVERALKDAQSAASAAASDILENAQDTWHSATRTASKVVGATPSPETVEEYYDFAKAQAGEKVQVAYDHARSVAHDASRSVVKAAGGTPSPESLQDHVDNVAAAAQDTLSSVSSVVESVYGAATSNVYENIHQATRTVMKAAGATPTPETAEEFYDYVRGYAADKAQAVYEGASSLAHDASRTVVKAAGGTPSPESLHEHYESLVGKAQSVASSASSVVESAYGAATSNVQENLHKATRSVMSAAGASPTPETAEEYYDFAKAQAQAAYAVVGDAVHDGTRTLLKAVGATPSPENLSEHASSLAEAASKSANAAYASASSAAANVADRVPSTEEVQARVEEILASASSAIEEVAGGATNLAESVYDAGSSALHQATRTVIKAAGGTPTPETFGEHIESIVDAASQGVHHATRSVIKAAGGTPEPESLKEHYESVVAQVSEAVVGAGAVAGEVVDSLYSSAHSATRSAYKAMGGTPTPETFGEHYESVVAQASSVASDGNDKASAAATAAYDTLVSAGSAASASAASAASVASEQASSLASKASDTANTAYDSASSALHQGTRTVLGAVGVTPSPENLAETVSSLSARATDSVASVAAVLESLAAEVGDNLASATDSVKSAVGVESAKPLTERAASSVLSVLDSLASEADTTFTKATDSVKSAAGVETAKPVTERASSSAASVASSISSYIYHEEL